MSDSIPAQRTLRLPDGHGFSADAHINAYQDRGEFAHIIPVTRPDGVGVTLAIGGVHVQLSPHAWLAVIAELTEVIADLPIDQVVA